MLTTHRSGEIVVSCTIAAVVDVASTLFGSHFSKFVEPRRHGHAKEVLVFTPRVTEERADAVESLNDGVRVVVECAGSLGRAAVVADQSPKGRREIGVLVTVVGEYRADYFVDD